MSGPLHYRWVAVLSMYLDRSQVWCGASYPIYLSERKGWGQE